MEQWRPYLDDALAWLAGVWAAWEALFPLPWLGWVAAAAIVIAAVPMLRIMLNQFGGLLALAVLLAGVFAVLMNVVV